MSVPFREVRRDVRLGASKQFVEPDWKRRLGYRVLGELHVPGWIRLQHILRQLDRFVPVGRPLRFLDAGCGRGDLITYLAERNPSWSFVGLELEDEPIRKAEIIRKRLGLNQVSFQQMDICNLPFKNEFDIAVCSDVMEHVPDDERAFGSLIKALKPGGVLIVTAPSVPQPQHLPTVAWRERRIGFDPSDYGHVRQGYSESELREMFVKNGADPVLVRYTYGAFGTLAFDIFFSIGDSQPSPLVFALLFPVMKALGWMDLHQVPRHGAAIMGFARKNSNGNGSPA